MIHEPLGAMALSEACMQVFRKLGERGWVSMGEVAHEVSLLTGVAQLTDEQIKRAAWTAGNRLAAAGEMVISCYQNGYKREGVEGQIAIVDRRMGRIRRASRRMSHRASVALLNPELAGPDRQRIERQLAWSDSIAKKKLRDAAKLSSRELT